MLEDMNRFIEPSKKIGDNFVLKNVILAVMVFLTYPLNRPTKTRTRTKTVFETVEKPPVWTPENEKLKPSN